MLHKYINLEITLMVNYEILSVFGGLQVKAWKNLKRLFKILS